jgi:hypothetical protein
MAINNSLNAQAVYQREVERCIFAVISEFRSNPELYLTESDLKCRLYRVLSNHPLFRRVEPPADGKTATCYVHTETSYFV